MIRTYAARQALARTDLLLRLRKDPWFASLSDALCQALVDRSVIVRYAGGEPIYLAGDISDGMYGIVQGAVQMQHLTSGGYYGMYYVKRAPSWFGELDEFDERPRAQNAIAVGPVKVLHLSHAAFQAIVTRQPAFWRDFASLLGGHVRELFDRVEAMATSPARVRLAQSLLTTHVEAQRAGADGANDQSTTISQESLAAMVGISRQTASKILKRFEKQRLVRLSYRSIQLLDVEGIRAEIEDHGAG